MPIRFGNPDELQVRPGRYGAELLAAQGPASAPAAMSPTDTAPSPANLPAIAQGGMPMRSDPRPAAGAAPAPAAPQAEWPDWMTDDDKAFASMAEKAAQSYTSRVQKRRTDRSQLQQYSKLVRERDKARSMMEDLAGVLKENPALFYEDKDTPNSHGMAIIRQLSKYRQSFKRAKEAEQSYMKQMQSSGMKVPQKDELTDDDLLAMQSADDEDFDRQVGEGYSTALSYMGNQ